MSKDNTNPDNNSSSPEIETPEVKTELSKVAMNPKQSAAIIGIVTVAGLALIYNLFFSKANMPAKKGEQEVVEKPALVNQPTREISGEVPIVPTLPKAPEIKPPVAPPPPVVELPKPEIKQEAAMPPLPSDMGQPIARPQEMTPTILPKITDENKSIRDTRKKSSIMLISGVPQKSAEEVEQLVDFKPRKDLEYILSRGKLIDAIIENAINTDFGGEIRAIISRDVYSESGHNILIPKGSKIFGTYGSNIDTVHSRVNITWQRIDLVSGYTINFSGNATDNLGRKGVSGRLDNKYAEIISNSILSTALNVAFATALDKVVAPPEDTNQAQRQQQQASSVRNMVQTITSGGAPADDTAARLQITQICSQVPSIITDTTSTAYQSVQTACNTAQNTASGATDTQKLTALISSINQAADALLITTASSATKTKAQQAAEEGFKNFSQTVLDMTAKKDLKPTITIDQGAAIKIYVNKDYKFPKSAVNKARMIK